MCYWFFFQILNRILTNFPHSGIFVYAKTLESAKAWPKIRKVSAQLRKVLPVLQALDPQRFLDFWGLRKTEQFPLEVSCLASCIASFKNNRINITNSVESVILVHLLRPSYWRRSILQAANDNFSFYPQNGIRNHCHILSDKAWTLCWVLMTEPDGQQPKSRWLIPTNSHRRPPCVFKPI